MNSRTFQCPPLKEDFLPDLVMVSCIHQARSIDLVLGLALPEIKHIVFLAPGEEVTNDDGQWQATYTGICSGCHTTYQQVVSAPYPDEESWDLFNASSEQDSEDSN